MGSTPPPAVQADPAGLLQALTQISHAVSNAVSLEPIMRLAAEQAALLLGAERSVVLLTDDAGGLRIRSWYGLEPTGRESFPGPLNESLIERLAPVLGEPSADAVLAVPLVVGGRVTGLIAAALGRRVEFSGRAEVILTALADQMAAPLENARMAEEVRQAQLLIENARLHEAERAARQAADEGRDVLQALMEHIPEGITIADAPDARIRLVSRFGLELLDRPWSEVAGLSAEQQASLLPMGRPDSDVPARADELPLTRAIRDGSVVRGEEWVLWRADGSRVPLLCDAGAIRDQEGKITGGVMAWREISTHKRMQEQLAQARRLQAVGRLTGGVAHEVNNMMTVVIGFGHLVLQELMPGHPRRSDVEQMVQAAGRAAGVTQQLLAFSRQQVLQPSVIALDHLVENLAPLLRQLLGTEHTLELRHSPERLPVFADQSQLEQVLVNLVSNARDAMGSGGRVTIETAARVLDQTYARSHSGVAVTPGWYAAVTITDTGIGMSPATQARVFEPFYTTKAVGEGTGLGLATVYGIVKQSDGYIWIYSELGLGTTVKVYLPLTSRSGNLPAARDSRPALGGGETILVVEDEPAVREFIRRSLEALGYGVVEAESAKDALAQTERSSPPVDLILSDVVMPGQGARAMAEAVWRSHPAVPVLFMSGYPGEDVVRRGLLTAEAPFLQKPFTLEDLAQSVRSLLDGVGGAG
jgi:signal transduction histidine kinase